MGRFRWLTVGPAGQPDLEIVLMPLAGFPMKDEAMASLRALVQSGELGAGVFATRDCRSSSKAGIARPAPWTWLRFCDEASR
jgi:hypothetical protein